MRRASSILALTLFAASAVFAVEPATPRMVERDRTMRHVIVHSASPLTPSDEADLASKGVIIGRALKAGSYLARAKDARTVSDARLTAIETLTPEKKISRSALRETTVGRTWAELNVYFHEDVPFEEARASLLAAGAAIEPLLLDYGVMNRITAKVPPESLHALASDDAVLSVSGPIRYRLTDHNARTAVLSHVKDVHEAPYGLTGAGVTVSLFELAPAAADHPEFQGRLTVQESVTGGSNGNRVHATHVAGTIAAAGIVNPDAKGMAPAARVFQFCVRSGSNTCKNNFLDEKDEELPKLGSLIDNNSWGYVLGWDSEDYPVWTDGDILWGAYWTEVTGPIDAIALERNILFVHSAGNDGSPPSLGTWAQHRHVDDNGDTITDKIFCYSQNGSGNDCPTTGLCTGTCETIKHHTETPYDTIGVTASGKNTITVGAVHTLADTPEIATFSSRGPAKDGRVKPDVVTRGQQVLSTTLSGGYASNQGTSMSSPAVAGVAALLVEQYRKTFGTDPDPVMLKALIVGGADDLGRPGPDFTFGFGLLNAKASADLIINNNGRGINSVTVGNGQTAEFPLVLSAPQANMRVVMQWGDPAIPYTVGNEIADKALVNDLDIKLIAPDGTEHLPYVLDKTQLEANATRGVNTVDNTEMIDVANAPAGVYRAIVTGKTIAQGTQRAVIVSTARAAAPCVDATESSNNSGYGDLVPGATVFAALCSQSDVDIFRWTALPGAVNVTFTTGDTALTVDFTGGFSQSVTIPANTTQTVSGTVAGSGATAVTMNVRASGSFGAEPIYSFTPQFTQQGGGRKRSARH